MNLTIKSRLLMLATLLLSLVSIPSYAANNDLSAIHPTAGIAALFIFILAYSLVILEEKIHLRKSKPVIVAAGLIWMLVALAANVTGDTTFAETAIEHAVAEYGALFLFLLVAMTFVNSMEERAVFSALRVTLINKGFSYRQIFWVTGILAFFISALADNLTTALLMCAVVVAIGQGNQRFVSVACVNIVVAANAGGAFSPFGDITTLMVWQKGVLNFFEFFQIFIPSVVNYIIPAWFMHFAIPKETPPTQQETARVKPGAMMVILLFLVTISLAVTCHIVLHLPPMLGMMTGLGLLQLYGYRLKLKNQHDKGHILSKNESDNDFEVFDNIAKVEWDTLLFFYGVMMCVAGLAAFGYLSWISSNLYENFDYGFGAAQQATIPNVIIGVLSAIVDNIPVMYAVLTMQPTMSDGQWLLVTLTAGTGGSLLSVGSAAGVALMGQARGLYTFSSHLKWTWAIGLGYIGSILVHLLVNQALFQS